MFINAAVDTTSGRACPILALYLALFRQPQAVDFIVFLRNFIVSSQLVEGVEQYRQSYCHTEKESQDCIVLEAFQRPATTRRRETSTQIADMCRLRPEASAIPIAAPSPDRARAQMLSIPVD